MTFSRRGLRRVEDVGKLKGVPFCKAWSGISRVARAHKAQSRDPAILPRERAAMTHNKSTGDQGEALVCAYLEARGYEIVARNWRCLAGEIDIVARHGDTLVFVEVKTRRRGEAGDAFASITERKRGRILAAAYEYVAAVEIEPAAWQIDGAAVLLRHDGTGHVTYVEDILGW
ncbi:MAG: YraN family protein [Anaerolineae bacterium]|nr:YraN family protein [Chloroflexota bacterium]MBW7878167.1 YraN family protein [Anaerolineae bacterium]MDL1914569.1 YraN family protein [Anaerolineae bacterium CFX4]MCO6445485.1 YraN family protein [Anaerolineae bacterium]NOG49497.1 YraN family protein [Chloroflexota bacterium]